MLWKPFLQNPAGTNEKCAMSTDFGGPLTHLPLLDPPPELVVSSTRSPILSVQALLDESE